MLSLDRLPDNHLSMTQEFIANMLGRVAPLRGQVQGAGCILRMEAARFADLRTKQVNLHRVLRQWL